jgi:hypothetical protein
VFRHGSSNRSRQANSQREPWIISADRRQISRPVRTSDFAIALARGRAVAALK